jgi:hypothetical protein
MAAGSEANWNGRRNGIAIFLGAGFSAVGGAPLASQLFDSQPVVDRITRQRLVERVLTQWNDWESRHRGAPEEYLAFLQEKGGRGWRDALWYVGLIIALRMGRLEYVGMQPTITRHNIDRTTRIGPHEDFWSTIFRRTEEVGVITTNYDVLAERGLRHEPRPRVPRPGFHYGGGLEYLEGGGYPSYAHIQRISASGQVPLLKLHGSVSWSYRGEQLLHYHDCRPAIRGDAAIVAPVTAKVLPHYLRDLWEKAHSILAASSTWLVVGYSLPEYDELIRELFVESLAQETTVHIFNPDLEVVGKFSGLLRGAMVHAHAGLPEGLKDLEQVLETIP